MGQMCLHSGSSSRVYLCPWSCSKHPGCLPSDRDSILAPPNPACRMGRWCGFYTVATMGSARHSSPFLGQDIERQLTLYRGPGLCGGFRKGDRCFTHCCCTPHTSINSGG